MPPQLYRNKIKEAFSRILPTKAIGPQNDSSQFPRLICVRGMDRGKTVSLNRDKVTIGRYGHWFEVCTQKREAVFITDQADKTISRPNSIIYYSDGNYYIADRSAFDISPSANGTHVNGIDIRNQVDSSVLSHGDEIRIGNTVLYFEEYATIQGHEPLPITLSQDITDFKLLEKIAQGGMGEVYKAQANPGGEIVVVKLISKELLSQEPNTKIFFEQEARLLKRLENPNVIRYLDSGIKDEMLYIMMEYADGDSLRKVIDRLRPLKIEDAIKISITLLNGLEYCHNLGAIHRDIKPGNIMFNSRGELKIIDFGIARNTYDTRKTLFSERVLGAPSYMPPEQISSDFGDMDNRTDIYATGILLYEMVTGHVPFSGKYGEIIVGHLTKEPLHPSSIIAEIPQELDDIILKALQKNKENRYQTASQFREDLKELLINPHDGYTFSPEITGVNPEINLSVIDSNSNSKKNENPIAQLTLISGEHEGEKYILNKNQIFLIGSTSGNNLILNDTTVRSRHTIIVSDNEGNLSIQKSAGIAYLNKKKIQRKMSIQHKDLISIGRTVILVEYI